MKVLILVVSAGLLVGSVPVHAGQGRGSAGRHQAASATDRAVVRGEVRVVFSTRDTELIRAHYAPRYSNLPPGLQKKLARTGQLPPGWQKKMEAFPPGLERQLSPLPAGYSRGVFDGRAVIYVPGTSVVIDAAVLF